MTDLESPLRESFSPGPAPIPARRAAKPKPKRAPTRVSIVEPDPTTSPRSSVPVTSPSYNVKWDTWKCLILTIDGGGIRGYSSLIILRALMREIERIEKSLEPRASASTQTDRIPNDQIPEDVLKDGQYLPCHYFDYIAGTSVGGLVAIMLGMFGKSVDDCIREFHQQNKAIPLTDDASVEFPLLYRRNTWPTKRTRSFFDTFANFAVTATARTLTGTSATPSLSQTSTQSSSASTVFRKDVYQCQTLAWCTEVDARRSRRPYAFCTFAEEETDTESPISIPEVAKAITTPSRYSFKPFKLGSGHFVDGTKLVRNPTLEVIKEITALFDEPEPPIHLLLSLGTDEHHAWFYEKLRSLSFSSTTNTSGADKSAIHNEKGVAYTHYHRFEVPGVKLGWRKKFFLREIEDATEAWLAGETQKKEIAQYARMLVERRRARAATVRWETFALGVRYVCFHEACVKKRQEATQPLENQIFTGRGNFFDHLDRRHDLMRMSGKGLVDVEAELDKGRRFGCS
ncbi:patatin-like phospholipase-domain-containing protein [Chaetomium sp. MPI-SDFR-AT-0129]|nr:patatin-like phospholipase-domain-containing protein [Chaetomium sp. MPI-SDFR-AT-0129]